MWKSTSDNRLQSVIGYVQIYNDKYQTSLEAGDVTFYPLYMKLLYISKRVRHTKILSSVTIVGYLPVPFYFSIRETIQCKSRSKVHQGVATLRFLHGCTEICLKSFTKNTKKAYFERHEKSRVTHV